MGRVSGAGQAHPWSTISRWELLGGPKTTSGSDGLSGRHVAAWRYHADSCSAGWGVYMPMTATGAAPALGFVWTTFHF